MKLLVTVILAALCGGPVMAQGLNTNNIVYPMIGNASFVWKAPDAEGSPFMADEWLPGMVIDVNDSVYRNLRLKFDVYSNRFIYNRNDTLFTILSKLREVRLTGADGTEMVFRSGFPPAPEKLVQVLAQGKITLIKYWSKGVEEYQQYGSAPARRFTNATQFYITQDGVSTRVVPGKKELEKLLADKWNKVEKYMADNQVSAKTESGWVKALAYYNSL